MSANLCLAESLNINLDESCTLIQGDDLKAKDAYLRDESRKSGHASMLALPTSETQVAQALQEAKRQDLDVTISGARTGITAGAVPFGGAIISLERMDKILGLRKDENGNIFVTCQAGVTLATLQNALENLRFTDEKSWSQQSREILDTLRKTPHFFPPDPTETSASIGGCVACNASGAHTFRYGPTRDYVNALNIILADGSIVKLKRGQAVATDKGTFTLIAQDGTHRHGKLPTFPWPKTKNAAGYYSNGRDLLDLFIGSEGTLGIITEVELRLIPKPQRSIALMAFWENESKALDFVETIRKDRKALALEAIEYFGEDALDMLRKRRALLGAASGVPAALKDSMNCAIYIDIGCDEASESTIMKSIRDIIRQLGGNTEHCWCATENDMRERLRLFRHALPETVNSIIAQTRRQFPNITKLGTDMAVPDSELRNYVNLFHDTLSKNNLKYVTFGHIGDNHLHVNILPGNPDDYDKGKKIYFELAQKIVQMGGSPSAEHGIGKLKTNFLELMAGPEGIREMKDIKAVFDPDCILGKHTLFQA